MQKPRSHREPAAADGKPAPVGWDIIKALSGSLKEYPADKLQQIMEAKATSFITEGDKVVGVVYEDHAGEASVSFFPPCFVSFLTKHLLAMQRKEVRGDGVVMCTGGFCCDRAKDSLIVEFAPKKAKLATTNGAFASGDGIRMGRAIGVQLIHMDKVMKNRRALPLDLRISHCCCCFFPPQIQVHPTGFVDPKDPLNPVKFLGPEALRGCGGILLNKKGERFVNELGRRDHVSQRIFDQSEGGIESDLPATALIVMNDDAVLKFGKATWHFYCSK